MTCSATCDRHETYVEVSGQLIPDVYGDLVGGEEKVKVGVGGERH